MKINDNIPTSIEHLTIAQWECLNQAYKILKLNFEDGDWFRKAAKRAITRAFYMQTKSFKSGLISTEAYMKEDYEPCADHCYVPQAYCFYIMANWETIGKSLETFFPHWAIASITIDVTPKQNKDLSKFSVNNKSTGNVMKVKIPLIERYKKCGIALMEKESGDIVDFDILASRLEEGYNEWEKAYMII